MFSLAFKDIREKKQKKDVDIIVFICFSDVVFFTLVLENIPETFGKTKKQPLFSFKAFIFTSTRK